MSRLFEDRITPAGIEAIQDLIDHVAEELNQTIETQGEGSPDAAQKKLILASLYQVAGGYEKADPLIRGYGTMTKEKYTSRNDYVAWGLILLSHNYIGLERREDSFSVLEKLKICATHNMLPLNPLLEGLYELGSKYRKIKGPINERRGFILFLMALSWYGRYPSDRPIYSEFLPLLKAVFEPYGFVGDLWEWLVKGCNPNLHDPMGLISMLLEKHILPLDAQPPLTAEMREEFLRSLVQEFPFQKSGLRRG